MDKPRRLLTKLELAIEIGYVKVPFELERAYRLYQAENAMNRDYKSKARTYAQDPWLEVVRNSKYKDNAKRINHRVDRIIHNIMEKEEDLNARSEEKIDMLKPRSFESPIQILDFGDFPKKEYNPEDVAYDRNQFIRSYFRYKDYKVEKGHLKVKKKQIDLKNEPPEITLPIIIFSQLYSFDEIIKEVFSSGIIRDKGTKEILKIDFPLTSSVIEKVISKYGIEPIMFSHSTIKYLFRKDLLYLNDTVPCLKFRNFTITHTVFCTLYEKLDGKYGIKYGTKPIIFSKSTINYLLKKDSLYLGKNVSCLKFRNFTITHNISFALTDRGQNNIYQSVNTKKKYLKEKKVSYHPRLRQVIWRKTKPGRPDDTEIINVLWDASKYLGEAVVDPKNISSLSINEKSNIILEFFEKLPNSDEVCVIYESFNDVPAQIGYGKYDAAKEAVIINDCDISIEKIISIQRIANCKTYE